MRPIPREMRDMRLTALLAHYRSALDNECRRNARMNVIHLSYFRSADSADDDPALRTTNSFFLCVPRRFFRRRRATPLGSGGRVLIC